MEKFNLKRKESNSNKIYNPNTNNKKRNLFIEFPLENISLSEEEFFENTYNNNISKLEHSISNNQKNKKFKNSTKPFLIPLNNDVMKNINNNLRNTLKQSNSNNYLRKIKNEENKLNNNYAKIKNTKKKKDININKEKQLKYKTVKYIIQNPNNKIIKGKITRRKNISQNENNLFYNKYIKEENKMINYNYFVLNPKNINENKKIETNLIQNIIKYPINKNKGNNINNNIYMNRVNSNNSIKNKDLYKSLRNSFYKENEDNNSNSQELLNNNCLYQNQSLTETISNPKNNKDNINKELLKHFSRTFVEIKDIKTIEPMENYGKKNIIKQNKKIAKSFQKKWLNNISNNMNRINNNKIKKKDLTLKIFENKNINLDSLSNNQKITRISLLYKDSNNIKKYSYNNTLNNTINIITGNETALNKNIIIPIKQSINNKNLSLNKNQKSNKPNKKNKIIIYKKRKISNHKCQSKIKRNDQIENDNNYIYNYNHNYYTENKKEKSDNINNFIQLSKNMKKVELFKALTSERKILINNKKEEKEENQPSYIYMKSILKKWKNKANNISLNSKVNNKLSFKKKYYNFFLKRNKTKICFIAKRYKFRAPINKLCIFSKNIILKESMLKLNQSNNEEGNNTIIELNSSKFSKLNNTNNKNMEILEEYEENDNEDFNIDEYEKNNSTKFKQIFKIEKGLEKLCRIFFRNLEKKNKENKIKNKEIKYICNNLNLKKEKSEPNFNFKTKKTSGLFSSTIQNWNYFDKKNYKKEDENDNEIVNIKNKKKQKKKHSLLLNIHKAFSEEKIRDQIQIERRSVNLKSKFLFSQKQIDDNNNINNNIIIDPKDIINNIINNLSQENYTTTLIELFNLISNKNNENNNCDYNNFEIILNNQFTFVETIVEKSLQENNNNISLYAKLCYDLYIRLISDFSILNKKKTKGENLKSILKSECKQKFDECDIITLLNISKINKENNIIKEIKKKLIGIIEFISELIKVKIISQKMGLEYLDIINKRINNFDNDIKNYGNKNNLKQIKKLYYESEIILLEKISIIIIERKKPKHIQNLKNFIEDNIIPIINSKSNKEINKDLIFKLKNYLNEIKKNIFFKDIKYIDDNINKDIISLKNEILDYIKYITENEKKENSKEENDNINDDFNWNIVDDLIINKKITLDKIIIYYIQICEEIIKDNSHVFKANKYIKSVINYYSYNLNKENIESIHLNIIKIFLDIDIICNSNIYMHKVIGLLLFVLLTNNKKLFYIKDLNNYLSKDINIKINLAKCIKFTIIAYGKNWKKYYNYFKKSSLFCDSDIFNEYIANPMKLNGFKL